jgi:site-specific DNA recombinase
MKIALYARNSTMSQAERGTTEAQLSYLREWAKQQGHDVVAAFTEEATSGKVPLIKRPVGKELLTQAKTGAFKALAVYRADRFGRSTLDSLEALRELRSMGVGFISATEAFGNDPDGMLFLTIALAFAQREADLITQRCMAGKRRAVTDGRYTGAVVPYGYVVEDGRLVPSPIVIDGLDMTEAALVKVLYERTAAGESLTKLSKWLDSIGVKPVKRYSTGVVLHIAPRWNRERLGRMIHSRTYKGEHAYKFKAGTVLRDVPPLVDNELWERANEMVAHRAADQTPGKYLLTGVLRCALCGQTYLAHHSIRGVLSYRCRQQIRGICTGVSLRGDVIEPWVWEAIAGFLSDVSEGETAYTEFIRSAEAADIAAVPGDDPAPLQAELVRLERGYENLVKALAAGDIDYATTAPQLDVNKRRQADIRHMLVTLGSREETIRAIKRQWSERRRRAYNIGRQMERTTPSEHPEWAKSIVQQLRLRGIVETIGEGRHKEARVKFSIWGKPWYATVPASDAAHEVNLTNTSAAQAAMMRSSGSNC